MTDRARDKHRADQPLLLRRPAMLRVEQLERIEEAAVGILRDVGISVGNETVLERLRKKGFRVRESNRVRIEPAAVKEFLRAEREANGNAFASGPMDMGRPAGAVTLGVSPYNLNWHEAGTESIVPMTTERLIEAVKLCEVLRRDGRGLTNTCAGTPTDAAGKFQSVLRAWVLATYSAANWCEGAWCLASMPYELEIGEVLGHRMTQATVYVFSPLHLGGESLECALAAEGRIDSLGTGGMPAAGSTAPIHAGDAFALSAAESVGAAILLREAFGKPVHFSVSVYPMDPATLAMVFGSPENLLLQMMSAEVDSWFHGRAWYPAAGNIHTMAKLPGSQASAEKSSIMTAGALLGARGFGCAGSLSLDEIFSAEQLLVDVEIKDHVERLVAGLEGGCAPARAAGEAREALAAGSFAGLDSTVEGWREVYWRPAIFERGFLSHWRAQGGRTESRKVREQLAELIASHDYRLESDKQRAIDEVLSRAKEKLA